MCVCICVCLCVCVSNCYNSNSVKTKESFVRNKSLQ